MQAWKKKKLISVIILTVITIFPSIIFIVLMPGNAPTSVPEYQHPSF